MGMNKLALPGDRGNDLSTYLDNAAQVRILLFGRGNADEIISAQCEVKAHDLPG